MTDFELMGAALEEARKAAALGEVPVGAVVVLGDRVLAACGNQRERDARPTAHAELLAIERAARELGVSIITEEDILGMIGQSEA